MRVSGLSAEQTEEVVESDAFGPLTAELRRAEANYHDVDALLPRLLRARGFGDADDVAAVLRHRVATATSRAAGSGHSPKVPRLIAGLIPEVTGVMSDEMYETLEERRLLMEERADAVLVRNTTVAATWLQDLGAVPVDPRRAATWMSSARVVAAYRDRYSTTTDTALGTPAEATTQKVDRARAEAALRAASKLSRPRNATVPSRAVKARGLQL